MKRIEFYKMVYSFICVLIMKRKKIIFYCDWHYKIEKRSENSDFSWHIYQFEPKKNQILHINKKTVCKALFRHFVVQATNL